MSKVVLVTGAGGFIGRYCLPLLVKRGYEVHAVSRSQRPCWSGRYVGHVADICDPGQVSAIVDRIQPSHLLHLAWLTTPGRYWTSPANLDWLAAGVHLARAFVAQGGKRMTVAGTCAEYDWRFGYCHEDLTPLRPASIYGASKVSLHEQIDELSEGSGLSVGWGRLFFPFGPGDQPERLMGSVCRQLLSGKIADCSSGEQMRDFIYVEDAADALVALLDSEVRRPVNIASGRPRSVQEVVRYLASRLDTIDRVRFGTRQSGGDDSPLVVGSVTGIRNALEWRPRYTFEQAIDSTISWWRGQIRPADGSQFGLRKPTETILARPA